MKPMHNMIQQSEFHAGKTCAGMVILLKHIFNVKNLKFSETAFSFRETFLICLYFPYKIWRERRTRRASARCKGLAYCIRLILV